MQLFTTLMVLSVITIVRCCENITSVICETTNNPHISNPCEDPICSCSGRFKSGIYFTIQCISLFDVVPADLLSDVNAIDFQYNDFQTIRRGDFDGYQYLFNIYLRYNNISTIETGAFLDVPRLSILDLSHNNLSRIKKAMFKDLNVNQIYLDYNVIKVIETGAFDSLRNLDRLTFSGNNLTDIESGAFNNVGLPTIDLSKNEITRVRGKSFWNMPNLQMLNISINKIQVIETEAFTELPNLVVIDLKENNINVIETKAFTELPKLQSILLSRQNITIIETQAFSNLSVLETINLSSQNITIIETKAFNNLSNLKIIYLSNNKIKRLTKHIFWELPKLVRIELRLNMITVIESHAFDSLTSLEYIDFGANGIQVIESRAFNSLPSLDAIPYVGSLSDLQVEAFWNLSHIQHIYLIFKEMYSIKERTFWNLPNITSIILQGNAISEIEGYAFYNLTSLTSVVIYVPVDIIRQYAFCNLPALNSLTMYGLLIQIDQNAFWNVHGRELVLGIGNDFVISENTNMNFSILVFTKNQVSCNCSLMWLSLWKQEQVSMDTYGSCSISNSSVSELIPENFTHCYDTQKVSVCDTSETIQLQCPSAYITSHIKQWFHTRNGHLIRSWTPHEGNNLNILEIKYCSQADAGEYTCMRTTNYTALPEINSTIQLIINGEITVEQNIYCNKSSGVALTCNISVGGSTSTYWTHSSKGTIIRKINGAIGNNMNTLVIPFCNFQDIGEYTCIWEFPGNVVLNKTSMLVVNGPPVITSTSVRNIGKDKIISVLFYSKPHPDEPWWYYDAKQVIIGQTFLQNTEFGDVDVRQHGVYVKLQGFFTTLTLVDFDSSSYGRYRCMIKNSYGSTETDIAVEQDIVPDSESHLTLVVVVASVSIVSVTIAISTAVVCIKRRKRHKKDANYQEPCQPSDNTGYDDMKIQNNRDSSAQYDFIEMSNNDVDQHGYLCVV